jgi:high frequency lysogenization protein
MQQRVLALSAIFQAAALVQSLARRGEADAGPVQVLLDGIFVTNPQTVAEVYGETGGLRPGLEVLIRQLEGGRRDSSDLEVARYLIGLTVLERKLSTSPEGLAQVAEGIERTRHTREHFGTLHPNTLAALADLYSERVSPLGARIMVQGDSEHLEAPAILNKIRALLLGGLRAAVLWRQTGGRRYQLLFRRGALVRCARDLLETARSQAPADSGESGDRLDL